MPRQPEPGVTDRPTLTGRQLGASARPGPRTASALVHPGHMGMFDWYELADSRACAVCGEVLTDWQGTDGPCGLFVWCQGRRGAVAQRVDDEVALGTEDRAAQALPVDFIISTFCSQGHQAWITCSCTEGIWTNAGPVATFPPASKFETRTQRRARDRSSTS